MKIFYKLITFIAGVALLTVAVAVMVASLWAFRQIKESAGARQHTYTVIGRADNLLSELKDAETGQRGYLLTGDEAFLEPYNSVRNNISNNLEELHKISSIGDAKKQLDAMAPLIAAKLAELARVIEMRRNHEMAAVLSAVANGKGKWLMDSIRSEYSSFVRIEKEALLRHDEELQSNMRTMFVVIVVTSLLALVFSILFIYFIYRETQNRLKSVVQKETMRLLEVQEATNKQLQQTNATLQVSEEKLAVTLNSIGDAVIATDADGSVTIMNSIAEQLTGWTKKESIGRPLEDIFHIINEETRQVVVNPVRKTLAHGTIQGLANHTILVARAGGERVIDDSCAPIRDRDGQVLGAVIVFRDITRRREIENGLEKARKELEATKISEDAAREYSESIINTVREPLISLDQDLRVVSASRSFYEVFKVNPKETVGQLIYDLGNKQWDIPKLRELLETILPQKATFDNYEVEHDFAGIGRRIMLLNARQIQRVLGKKRIILLAIEDITERREIENGLKIAHEELNGLATELKRVAQVKSEFLANMSHELRTPLNSINGFSEVLYDETFGTLNEKQKRYTNNILTSGRHLLLLINQILDMAKVESGKMNLGLSNLPMKSILNEISLLVADLVAKKKLHMELEIAEDLPDIEADELKVKEILYNLLSNAVKFTPEGGKIGMRARSTGAKIEIEVWDTGVGIAVENMGKIFEGFFRVDTPYSRVTEGTGLGLPLSKKYVELHGGEFIVNSEGLDKGTSIRFTLPVVSGKGGVK